jgi:hypothetical protein
VMALGTAGLGKPTCCRRTWITKLLKLRPSARANASNLCLRSTGQRIDADCLTGARCGTTCDTLTRSRQERSRHPYKRSARLPLRNPRLMRSGRVREAREHASLGKHVTLDAWRHGGLTEAADAGATDQRLRARSGHKTTAASRVYLEQTQYKEWLLMPTSGSCREEQIRSKVRPNLNT